MLPNLLFHFSYSLYPSNGCNRHRKHLLCFKDTNCMMESSTFSKNLNASKLVERSKRRTHYFMLHSLQGIKLYEFVIRTIRWKMLKPTAELANIEVCCSWSESDLCQSRLPLVLELITYISNSGTSLLTKSCFRFICTHEHFSFFFLREQTYAQIHNTFNSCFSTSAIHALINWLIYLDLPCVLATIR